MNRSEKRIKMLAESLGFKEIIRKRQGCDFYVFTEEGLQSLEVKTPGFLRPSQVEEFLRNGGYLCVSAKDTVLLFKLVKSTVLDPSVERALDRYGERGEP